ALGVAVDASGVYVAGATTGDLPGHSLVGDRDAFVRKYDSDGDEQRGSESGKDFGGIAGAFGVAENAPGVYVVGLIGRDGFDAFVRKYDAAGNRQWHEEFGGGIFEDTIAFDVAVDASGVYVAGATTGDLPGQASAGGTDAFVRKYDTNGVE